MWPLSLNLEGGGGGGGGGDKKHYENRENDESGFFFFAQCVRDEPTKSRALFPLSYLTNKNPRAFVSVRKIKK